MNRSTTARGYGWRHQQARERWRRIVNAGQANCARCGLPILSGQPFDLSRRGGRASVAGCHAETQLADCLYETIGETALDGEVSA